MVRCTPCVVDEVLWPQYERLSDTLDAYLSDVTNRVVREAVHDDGCGTARGPVRGRGGCAPDR